MPEASADRFENLAMIALAFTGAGEVRANPVEPEDAPMIAPGEVVVGVLLGFGESTEIFVSHPLRRMGIPQSARSLVPLRLSDIGREVVLNFERGDPSRPLIVGCLWKPERIDERPPITAKPPEPPPQPDVEELILTAGKRIVLRCGEACLTLTEEGKVLIQGAYVSSRATGAHRIKGASVQIN